MNTSRIPGRLTTARQARVWASRFGALRRCVLREAAQVGGQLPLMPQPPRAALGTAIHKLFERAASDPTFSFSETGLAQEWDSAVREVEEFLSASYYMEGLLPLSQSIPNIGLMRSRTLLRLLEGGRPTPIQRVCATGKSKTFPGRLANKAGTVAGIPDRVEQTPIGPVISDYKTGITAEAQGPFWDDYQLQLKLYAALYHSLSGCWPARLELHGLDSSVHEVSFSADECSELIADAEALASRIAAVTSGLNESEEAQLQAASPSPTTCRFCVFRPGCPAYIALALRCSPPCAGDVYGTLRTCKVLGNGEFLVEFEGAAGCIRIRNLPPNGHLRDALQSAVSGQKMIVFNVVKTEEENPLYSPTGFTAAHCYGDESQ